MNTKVVLLVDDDSHVRQSIRRILARFMPNFTLIEAIDGAKALQVVEKWKGQVDLILCDVDMPVMTGDEFLRIAIGNYPHLEKKVLVTGNTHERSLFREWPLRRIEKPFEAAKLLRSIEEVLNEA